MTLNTHPTASALPEPRYLEMRDDAATLTQPSNAKSRRYEFSKPVSGADEKALRCDITVTWDAALNIAPIKIRAVTPRGRERSFRRWVVVQLPPVQARNVKLPAFVEFGDGAVWVAHGCHTRPASMQN